MRDFDFVLPILRPARIPVAVATLLAFCQCPLTVSDVVLSGLAVKAERIDINDRVRAVADSIRNVLNLWKTAPDYDGEPPTHDEMWQALQFGWYPRKITSVQVVVYANKWHKNVELLKHFAPFPVLTVRQEGEWKGTLDKLLGYWSFLQGIEDDAVVVFLDAFDVFPNGYDGHELLRRFLSFGKPVVISTEENIFPREVAASADESVLFGGRLGLTNASSPSKYVNAGGIIGFGWALRKIYDDMRENMAANNPQMLMAHADIVGHWFLHSYDQYELWRYFIRHVKHVLDGEEEALLALDHEQYIFGSTVFRKDNWLEYLNNSAGGVNGEHSIDVDVPLVFDAPLEHWHVVGCKARWKGRKHFPIFWHGHGPWKPAWEGLRDKLRGNGCMGGLPPKPAPPTEAEPFAKAKT
eukprot:TRINITY_DN31320_c0_g1_i1.p1 TRINITY_DN31320_c0_g1~~TRINITY_DN31320_c0_g1_i1.p1  ORF type:complete len:410 (+),score=64.29 TRINITY_DN31320_c0_g1_i1:111-1340(+)